MIPTKPPSPAEFQKLGDEAEANALKMTWTATPKEKVPEQIETSFDGRHTDGDKNEWFGTVVSAVIPDGPDKGVRIYDGLVLCPARGLIVHMTRAVAVQAHANAMQSATS